MIASALVTPAKAGAQPVKNAASRLLSVQVWAPAFAGVTEISNV
jgi:hypothetical protein